MQSDEQSDSFTPISRRPDRRRGDSLLNLLTILVLLGTFGLLLLFLIIFLNPYLPINPFPPGPALPTLYQIEPSITPIYTATSNLFPPTWTATPSLEPTQTFTPRPPTATPTITFTPINLTPATRTPTSTATPEMPFALRAPPAAVSSTITRPDSGCNWLGVGGQVLDLQGAPAVGYTIQLGGMLSNNPVDMLSLSGTALQYGTAGYEFSLADHPIASQKTLWIQLLDQAGLPLSARVYFETYNDCQKNLILISFKQVR